MKPRLAKIARIVAVQKQMHRLAEWQLIELQRQEEELREQARQLIQSLNGDVPLHGLFVEPMAKRLRSVGIATGAVVKQKETQTERVVGERRKLRHVERLKEEVFVDAARHAERARLDEVIERSILGGAEPPPPPDDEV